VKAILIIARLCVCLFFTSYALPVFSQEQAQLESEIEGLKAEVIELNRELFELEEQLLYPATTEFAVFVSMENIKGFTLQGIKLFLGENLIGSEIYKTEQVQALRRGGIQKLFSGNLKPGLHKVKAEILGKDLDGRPSKKMLVAEFGKARSSKFLEIKISKDKTQNQPKYAIVEWK